MIKRSFSLFLSLCLIFLLALPCFAADDKQTFKTEYTEMTDEYNFLVAADEYDYYISDYDIDIIVNENNSLNISETITTYFETPHHGIYRKVPLMSTVQRTDGSIEIIKAQISDIETNTEKSFYRESDNYVIKLGDPDRMVTGEQVYNIQYNYAMGKDTCRGFDEFYFNLIGTGWETVLNNVTFSIQMPKSFDVEKLGFSTGAYGTVGTDRVTYTVEGNMITGFCTGCFEPGEALTVRLELPDGYFIKPVVEFKFYHILYIAFCLISLLYVATQRKRHCNKKPIVPVISFYPPDGINSLEMQYWHDGMATSTGATSLLIYLASKGYLKIEEFPDAPSRASKFKITKLKEYDGNNSAEKEFIAGLFENGDEVYENNLKYSFYETISSVKDKAIENVPDVQKALYTKKSTKLKMASSVLVFLMALLLFPVVSPTMLTDITSFAFSTVSIMITFMAGAFAFDTLGKFIESRKEGNTKFAYLFLSFLLIFVTILTFVFFQVLLNSTSFNYVIVSSLIVGLISIISTYILSCSVLTREEYSHKIYEQILGFKEFIKTAEKEKLEMLVEENPTYFYDILPYAYILGVSDKWISKFNSITIKEPDWYVSSTPFSIATMNNFVNDVVPTINRAMTVTHTSSSGGGGFSGGGVGGGGGGAW